MTGRDWEAASVARFKRNADSVVARVLAIADRMEIESRRLDTDKNYVRIAGAMIHELTWGMANLNLSTLLDAAQDAQEAQAEKTQDVAGRMALVQAIRDTVNESTKIVHQNQASRGTLIDTPQFTPEDIMGMIDEAARQVGLDPGTKS